jgi:anti-sigma regulatory factor (Ser/Thr protein kinase)
MRLRKLVPTLDPAASTLASDIVEDLCADADLRDDVAVLAVHFGHSQAGLHMSKPARLGEIAPLRALLRRWFAAAGAEAEWIEDMVVAISETLANVCIHAYRPGTAGIFTLDLQLDGDRVEVVVRDSGQWRRRQTQGGGRGLTIVKALVPDTTIESTPAGTTVRLRARRWDERDAG